MKPQQVIWRALPLFAAGETALGLKPGQPLDRMVHFSSRWAEQSQHQVRALPRIGRNSSIMASDRDRKHVAAKLFDTTPAALGLYFRVYDSLFAPKEDYVLQFDDSDPQARTKPVTHDDILAAAAVLRRDPALTLDQASEQLAARPGIACSAQEFRFILLVST